jgi:hypothetical protein
MALVSRFLLRPICLALVAASAAGKNRALDAGLALVPASAYHVIQAGSDRVLIYGEGDLRHKMVLFSEADSIPDDGAAASAIRSLISEGELRYAVVEKNAEGEFHTREIHRPGPTGLLTTSTKRVAHQLGTRLLEVTISDSPEQTRAVLLSQARARSGQAVAQVDTAPFLAAQEWLEKCGERRVVVPFAEALAELVPTDNVRMRRDFPQLLNMVASSALLHQLQRGRTADGAIEATIADYALAKRLLAPVFEVVAAEGLTPSVRETVKAVIAGEKIGVTLLAKRLKIGKSTCSERVTKALAGGWLVNDETRPGWPSKLHLGEPLPDPPHALPAAEAVERRALALSLELAETLAREAAHV